MAKRKRKKKAPQSPSLMAAVLGYTRSSKEEKPTTGIEVRPVVEKKKVVKTTVVGKEAKYIYGPFMIALKKDGKKKIFSCLTLYD